MQKDNRLFKRYRFPDDTLYIFCKGTPIKGLLTDISPDGMGFKYFSIVKFRPKSEFKFILAGDKASVYVPDIPCKIIHDGEAGKSARPVTEVVLRHCGIQLGKLNAETKKELNEVLRFRKESYQLKQ